MSDCIFCQIVNGLTPCYKVWEDDYHLAFLSIFPNTDGVTVVIPKKHYPSYAFNLPEAVLIRLILAAKTVAGAMGIYSLQQFPADHHFWTFLSYCAGAGGSTLIIGSAAGIAAMGIAKIDFMWYLRRITPLAVAGYLAGAGIYLLQGLFFP